MPYEHIKEVKDQARITPIEIFPDPKTAIVILDQHSGKPLSPLVAVGDSVAVGQKIADSKERISSPVHSPISGQVVNIGNIYNHCLETFTNAIFIETDCKRTKDKSLTPICEAELEKTKPADLLNIIHEAGIIGLGGAGFPTHIKLSPPAEFPIKNLVVNATEGEPYDTADERLLVEKTENILRGVNVIKRILGNPAVTIATKVSKVEAIPKLQEVFGNEPDIKIVAGHFKYQQGDASVLQKALFGYEPSPEKRSYESGCIVQNVATINAIADAVFAGEPLISRVVAFNGEIAQPKNLLVKIGTPISDIFSQNNIDMNDVRQVVVGGVMMGHAIPTTEAPITKRSSSIIPFSENNCKKEQKQTVCIHCSKCISACPVKLHPILIYNAIMAANMEKAEKLWNKDCIGCGTCTYVCPSRLPLASTIMASRY
ncbi:MAG: electron transport complex subunit RsxC [Candidatus Bathyarchaeota archaeon]|nr:electron transport complex subunit RsxC [Candidatus Termiticorpusculum sp.]